MKTIRENYERTRNRVMTEVLAGSHNVDVIHIDPLMQQERYQPYQLKDAGGFSGEVP